MKLGLISDAHGHVEAFELGLSVLRALGADDIVFLGDAVGYMPGDGVVDIIRRQGLKAMLGNHDDMLMRQAFSATQDQVYRLSETMRVMTSDNRAALGRWPLSMEIDAATGPLRLQHGSPSDLLHGYVYPDTPLEPLYSADALVTFMGHTHRPFVRHCGDRLFVNIGSCGLPRDCGNLGSVAIYDDAAHQARIVRFDIAEPTAKALQRCGPVDASVMSVFERRGAALGEIYSE